MSMHAFSRRAGKSPRIVANPKAKFWQGFAWLLVAAFAVVTTVADNAVADNKEPIGKPVNPTSNPTVNAPSAVEAIPDGSTAPLSTPTHANRPSAARVVGPPPKRTSR